MKFACACGNVIYDITDNLRYKAHFVSDEDYFNLLDEIDASIEDFGTQAKAASEANEQLSQRDVENLIMKIRIAIGDAKRLMYQCSRCGRLYVDDHQRHLQQFLAENPSRSEGILRSVKTTRDEAP